MLPLFCLPHSFLAFLTMISHIPGSGAAAAKALGKQLPDGPRVIPGEVKPPPLKLPPPSPLIKTWL